MSMQFLPPQSQNAGALPVYVCSFPCRILNIVEDVAVSIAIPENETSADIVLSSFAVSVMETDPTAFQGQTFSIGKILSEDGELTSDSLNPSNLSQSTGSLAIPDNLFSSIPMQFTRNTSVRIVNAVYLNDVLFATRGNDTPNVVGSIILSTTLNANSEAVTVENLDPPIKMTFLKNPDLINGSNISCNFWDFSADGKSLVGIRMCITMIEIGKGFWCKQFGE